MVIWYNYKNIFIVIMQKTYFKYINAKIKLNEKMRLIYEIGSGEKWGIKEQKLMKQKD